MDNMTFPESLIDKAIFNILLRISKRRAFRFLQKLYFPSHGCQSDFSWDWNSKHFNRIAVMNLLIRDFSNCRYLEIGCASNSLFSSVPVKNKIGVDPARGGTHRMTSDLFFEHNTKKFDCIFIDGLHTYEQVKKDLINGLAVLETDGWIAIHDMLPSNWIEAHVPMITGGAWTGDVWKLAFDIIQSEDVDFRLVAIDHGVGVVRKRKTSATLIRDDANIAGERFKYLFENISLLPLVDWDEFVQWTEQNPKIQNFSETQT